MPEYIEREALLAKKFEYGSKWMPVDVILADDVAQAPAADVVPVVRCKDCKHLLKDLSKRGWHSCTREIAKRGLGGAFRVELNDFCSYVERKEQHDAAD